MSEIGEAIARAPKAGVYINGTTLAVLLVGGGKAYDYLDEQLEALEGLAIAVAEVRADQAQASTAQGELADAVRTRDRDDSRAHDEMRDRIAILEACIRAPKNCPLRGG